MAAEPVPHRVLALHHQALLQLDAGGGFFTLAGDPCFFTAPLS